MAEDNNSQPSSNEMDLDLTGLIKALDSSDLAADSPKLETPETGSANQQPTGTRAVGSESAAAASQQTAAAFDPNATMDYAQAGIGYPELPFADSEPGMRNGQTSEAVPEPRGRKRSESSRREDGTQRLGRTGGLSALDSQSLRTVPSLSDSQALGRAQSLSDSQSLRASRSSLSDSQSLRAARPSLSDSQSLRAARSSLSDSQSLRAARSSLSDSQSLRATRSSLSDSQSLSAARVSAAPVKTRSSGVRSRAAERFSTNAEGNVTAFDTSGTSQLANNYLPINSKKSAYRIRGGGRQQKVFGSIPVLLLAGLLCLGLGVWLVYKAVTGADSLLVIGTSAPTFELTQAQTRDAIDRRMPVLIDFIDYSIDDTYWSLVEAGLETFSNDRYSPDSPDADAEFGELILMPQEMTDEQMVGYYEGGFNAYSPEELTQYFNGAFMLDMSRGNLGNWQKLRYANLNAAGIWEEIDHVAELQQLSGDTVTITAHGIDSHGNYITQGQKVIEGERILYFRIAGCLFKDVYSVKTMSADSVYITCTVATYDFFIGTEDITPVAA